MKKSLFLILFCTINLCVFAYRPIGHVMLKDSIVATLETDNIFRIAMEKYPHIAAWGSIAPDLGYNVDLSRTFRSKWKRQIKNSLQLADLAHYHKVGTFLENLINKAKSTSDEKFRAFVGGWMTHIAGDFGAHDIYVKPEAGYYIAYEDGRDLHGDLEKIADAYLYQKNAHKYCLSSWDFHSEYYWPKFFGVRANPDNKKEKKKNEALIENMIGGNVEKYFIEVYKKTFEIDEVTFSLVDLASTYSRAVGEGLGKYAGFKQFSIMEAREKWLEDDRYKLIDSSFNQSVNFGISLITKATDPKATFSDKMNLDIGEDGGPTYIISIKPNKKIISRTKNDLYLTFKQKNGVDSIEVKITTKIGPLKFIFYQNDNYYYAVNLGGALGELSCWELDNLSGATLSIRPKSRQIFTNTLRVEESIMYYNGEIISATPDPTVNKPIKLKKNQPIIFDF